MWRRLKRSSSRRRRSSGRSSDDDRDEDGRSYRDLYEELAGLLNGTYYATIEQVWVGEGAEFGHEDEKCFTDLVRGSPPTFPMRAACAGGGDTIADGVGVHGTAAHDPNGGDRKSETEERVAAYEYTKECAEDDDGTYEVAAPSTSRAASSSRESSGDHQDFLDVWPVDLFGNGDRSDVKAQMAHLVPASSDMAAALYRDVAICALGLRLDAGWNATQKAIHGARRKGVNNGTTPETGDDRGTDPNATTTKTTTRSATRYASLPTTGIKHFATNRIRLVGHEYFLDNAPCVLIVPVLSLKQIKCWNGEEYRAIVMVGPWGNNSAQALCGAIGMQDKKEPFATPGEVETARVLLELLIKGLAYSLLERFPPAITDHWKASQKERLDELRAAFTTNLRIHGGLVVPKVNGEDRTQPLRVRMVEFASADGASSSIAGRHPAPDPLLLAVRAAVNWSARHDQRLLPTAAEPKDNDDEDDELDRLAEQEFLAWREEEHEREEQKWRNPSQEELARRLGQPNGYLEAHGDGGTGPSTGTGLFSSRSVRPAKRWKLERKARGRHPAA
jgi:hypothetical protein